MTARAETGYSDPYLAGVGLGLVLLAAYVVVGHGVGASGGFATIVATGIAATVGTARASSSSAGGSRPATPTSARSIC